MLWYIIDCQNKKIGAFTTDERDSVMDKCLICISRFWCTNELSLRMIVSQASSPSKLVGLWFIIGPVYITMLFVIKFKLMEIFIGKYIIFIPLLLIIVAAITLNLISLNKTNIYCLSVNILKCIFADCDTKKSLIYKRFFMKGPFSVHHFSAEVRLRYTSNFH